MKPPEPNDIHSPNPYASPQSTPAQYPNQPVNTGGVWRDGSILVMHKMAPLPDACIKSNEKTDGYRLKRNLSWHHPAIIISLLISPLIYILLAAILSKKATIHIGLSEVWRKKRKTRIMIGWLSFLLGIAMFVGGIALTNQASTEGVGVTLLLTGLMVSIVGGLYGLLSARLITPKRIDDQYIFIKGAHPDYLEQFPPMGMPQQPVPMQAMPPQV